MHSFMASRTLLLLAAGITGFSALCYEILWFRMLSNLSGSTAVASAVTTGMFLLGLALGSWWLGAKVDNVRSPLRLYIIVELVLVLCGLLIPFTLVALESRFSGSGVGSSFLLVGVSSLVILPPTIAMGGTLPVLGRLLGQQAPEDIFALIYTINTVGASIGTLLAGFVFIPLIGHTGTVAVAVSGNLFAALLAWMTRNAPENLTELKKKKHCEQKFSVWLLVAIAMCGAVALMSELLWIRLFPLYIGNTTHAFAMVLTVFLSSLAIGAGVYRRYFVNNKSRETVAYGFLFLFAVGMLPTILFFDQMAYFFYHTALMAHGNWQLTLLLRLGLIALIVAPAAVASGGLFPALVALTKPKDGMIGHYIGVQLFANTLGAVVGSLTVLPLILKLGTQGVFQGVLLVVALSAALLLTREMRNRRYLLGGFVSVLLAGLFAPNWNHHLMNSGVYIYGPGYERGGGLTEDLRRRSMLFHEEGLDATVGVFEDKESRHFTVNGKVDGGTADLPTQVLLGQLPMLVHPNPERVLVIGLGTGVTLNETLRYPGVKADCVEISTGVVKASSFFDQENEHLRDRIDTNLIIGDARRQLLTTTERYDVMISEPSNPWQSGNSSLFTIDFYQRARRSLKPGGIFCQWIPIYDLPPDMLRIAIRTFSEGFPAGNAFLVHGNDLILLGSVEAKTLVVDLGLLRSRWQNTGVRSAMERIGIVDSEDLVARYFLGGTELLNLLSESSRTNTEDHNVLEFHRFTPQQHIKENMSIIFSAMNNLRGRRFLPLHFSGNELQRARSRQDLASRYIQLARPQEASWILANQFIREEGKIE